ncbi:MarR family transcriptional regulator [Pantoea sp. PNT02]|uniref:MarR family transcriptional regulator n=2 Tax=Pantoea TaxID=53335 RepID=A0AAU7U1E5_9GAMM|nr:MarR family transcriptional regulator [Pantoea sp. PNT02]MBD9660120.1 MarR family transcriptional regulator [Pantoea sp. PNT03]
MMTMSRSVGMQLSFALYGAANRMARMHKPFLEPLGLTFPQYLVILELLNGSPLSVGTLGTSLDMDTGTITPLVKRLETAGFVTRTRDPNDERRVLVNLTPRAENIREEILGVTKKIKSACKLDEAGLILLRETLQDLCRPRND